MYAINIAPLNAAQNNNLAPSNDFKAQPLSNSSLDEQLVHCETLDAAGRYVASGLGVIPIRTDGSKAPALSSWKIYQSMQPSQEEINIGFSKNNASGIAILAGAVSGGLEVIDFDAPDLFPFWRDLVSLSYPDLIDSLAVVETPTEGRHVYYRCETIEGNRKLAQREHESKKVETLIETRGEGGYVIAPPSPVECHPTKRPYKLVGGDLTDIPVISSEERAALINAARSFNAYVKPDHVVRDKGEKENALKVIAGTKQETRPGDAYNAQADWDSLLTPHGWTRVGDGNGVAVWRRPGKSDQGISATTNYAGSNMLYVFSTNCEPFQHEKAYDLFAAYALLEHGGDFKAAAKALAAKGYGTPDASDSNDVLEADEGNNTRRQSAATVLVELVADAEFFHTPNDEAYSTIQIGSHHETLAIRSNQFALLLRKRFYEEYGTALNKQSVDEAVNTLESKALFGGEKREVYIRIAEYGDAIYVDLCNENWEVVEITAMGWRVVSDPPVRFRRSKGMQPLPSPVQGGSIDELRPFVNVRSDDDLKLITAWLIGCFSTSVQYPILSVNGEQGSAKSTASKVLRSVVDPNSVPLRDTPRSLRDLMVAAENSHVIAFDNLSGISGDVSDALCRLATGGGSSERQLYSNKEEVLFEAKRPVIFNGIEELGTRSDLLDRSILLSLPSISEGQRRPESEFWKDFEEARPRIFGALLLLVSQAVKNKRSVRLDRLPRMADFAIWSTAALGP
jgi:hypothetical protein